MEKRKSILTAGSCWLQRVVRRIWCYWNGHDLNMTWNCAKCERDIEYDEAMQLCVREKIQGWIKRKKQWWKCDDCGWRFGRHDPNEDHIPF